MTFGFLLSSAEYNALLGFPLGTPGVVVSWPKPTSMEQTASSGGSSGVGPDSEDEGTRSERTEAKVGRLPSGARGAAVDRFFSNQRRVGDGAEGGEAVGEVWDFERLASTPLLAAAFEDYARRALCHESVLFLTEVAR